MGWGGFLDKLLGKIPIQDRKERIRNKIDDLEREKNEIVIHKKMDVKSSNRLSAIFTELSRLRDQIRNLE